MITMGVRIDREQGPDLALCHYNVLKGWHKVEQLAKETKVIPVV